MTQNLVSLSVNIARAYEIAKSGQHSISLILPESQLPSDKENLALLTKYYDIDHNKKGADIVIELHHIGAQDIIASYNAGNRSETIGDINERICQFKDIPQNPELMLSGSNLSLLKVAIERLGLSIQQVNSILSVCVTIAKMSHSNTVKPEHLAEAIQYQSA